MSSGKQIGIASALVTAVLGSGCFIAAYFSGGDRLYEGLAIAVAAAGLSAAALGWAFWIVPQERVADEIETYPSAKSERAAESGELRSDLRAVSRPRVLLGLLSGALGAFAAALVVPFRSLGPAAGDALYHTRWRRGLALVREDGSAVDAASLNVDSAITVFPSGFAGDAQSQAMLIRLPDGVANSARGYIAYSRLCTHAGCPVALYRAAARQLLCPCHQSVFDVVANGAVVSGPADHALPRLPIAVAGDGTLIALGDFPEPVGPGFWERS
jgi:ubiquinol-cytochrome c reductase iron-sulfur subunit